MINKLELMKRNDYTHCTQVENTKNEILYFGEIAALYNTKQDKFSWIQTKHVKDIANLKCTFYDIGNGYFRCDLPKKKQYINGGKSVLYLHCFLALVEGYDLDVIKKKEIHHISKNRSDNRWNKNLCVLDMKTHDSVHLIDKYDGLYKSCMSYLKGELDLDELVLVDLYYKNVENMVIVVRWGKGNVRTFKGKVKTLEDKMKLFYSLFDLTHMEIGTAGKYFEVLSNDLNADLIANEVGFLNYFPVRSGTMVVA
jgi:hypothetical protein